MYVLCMYALCMYMAYVHAMYFAFMCAFVLYSNIS